MMRLRQVRMIWSLVIVALLCSTGCGAMYWWRPNATAADFNRESDACIKDATIAHGVGNEEVYRACMRSKGWGRVQGSDPNHYRGPEEPEEFGNHPAQVDRQPSWFERSWQFDPKPAGR